MSSLRRGARAQAIRYRPRDPVAFLHVPTVHWPNIPRVRQKGIYLTIVPVAFALAGFFLVMNTFSEPPLQPETPPPEMKEVQVEPPPPPPPEPQEEPESSEAEPEPLPEIATPVEADAPVGPAIEGASLDLALGSNADGLTIGGAGGAGPGGSGSGRMVLEPGQADQNPEIMDAPPPELPGKARDAGISGTFEAVFVVSAEGRPTQIVIRGEPTGFGFEEAILKSIKRRRYKPAMQGGAPVPMKLSVPFDFSVE